MKNLTAFALLLLLLPPLSAFGAEWPLTPQEMYPQLFSTVQLQKIFTDGKLFADALPREPPADIRRQFAAARPSADADLRAFVAAHFDLPGNIAAPPAAADQVPLLKHIDDLWTTLTRTTMSAPDYSSLLPLPKPYVVPGGRFRELYYWDSYFTMLGLVQSGRPELVQSMAQDFGYLIDHYGHVPNGARTYYLSRSQPPVFFLMAALTNPQDDAAGFAHYLPQLKREYAFWMDGSIRVKRGSALRRVVSMPDGAVLNRYWDDKDLPRDESFAEDSDLQRSSGRAAGPLFRDIRAAAESGWDFSSRWFSEAKSLATIDTTEIVPIDLNSLLFGLESAIRDGCQRSRNLACANEFKRRAVARRHAIDRYLWQATAGNYQDYRWTQRRATGRISAAMLYPLFVGVAAPAQAAAVAQAVRRDLLKPGGLVTTPIKTGQQWDAPNGWAPLQWIAVAGLRRTQQAALAQTIACRWMSNVGEVYRQTGKLVEKYDVMELGKRGGGGEYPLQDGFGWTNGVMRQLLALYPSEAQVESPAKCPGA